jgi:hypothetical protein
MKNKKKLVTSETNSEKEAKMKYFLTLFFFILASSVAKAQTINVDCRFSSRLYQVYQCLLMDIAVPDSDDANITIGGQHEANKSNVDVNEVVIQGFNVPFILTQAFSTFPNLQFFYLQVSGLTRIQPNAFVNGGGLILLDISFEKNITHLPANGFVGLSRLQRLELNNNPLQTIDENAFIGLDKLTDLVLNHNFLRVLPTNVFKPLHLMVEVYVSWNQLESLDGQLFANNPLLEVAMFYSNQINSVGRNFLIYIRYLQKLEMRENRCVNKNWIINNNPTRIENVREDLEVCFDNLN